MWRQKRLTRILMEKDQMDRKLFSTEQNWSAIVGHWYVVNHRFLTEEALNCFVASQFDEGTNEFLEASLIASNNICLQLYYSLIASMLSVFLTKTSINGLLDRGRMFIFSHSHLKTFLALPDEWSPIGRQMLDIGAGDGTVTAKFSSFFNDIYVVEASKIMEWRLTRRGFTVLPLDKWESNRPYELISALNLLDRHHDPKKLLKSLHKLSIEHNCPVLLSVVLPVRQFVEFDGGRAFSGRKMPVSDIPTEGTTYEAQVNSLIGNVLRPSGFAVIRWTRLPYLCEGDLSRAYYVLDDAVFLLNATLSPTEAKLTLSENGGLEKNEL